MKVFLVRHADAEFGNTSDHQRPLSALGQHQALKTADYLQQNIHSNEVTIICSNALRTHTTANIIAKHIQSNPKKSNPVLADHIYYHATVGQWCDGITAYQNNDYLILVGHNPTISYLSKYLNSMHAQQFSPACVAQYQLEIKADGLKLPASFIDFFNPNA